MLRKAVLIISIKIISLATVSMWHIEYLRFNGDLYDIQIIATYLTCISHPLKIKNIHRHIKIKLLKIFAQPVFQSM